MYPSSSAASAYSIVQQWADAATRARSLDSEALIKALEGHRYTLLKDEQQWRAFDHQNLQTVYAVKVKNRDEVLKGRSSRTTSRSSTASTPAAPCPASPTGRPSAAQPANP